MIYKGSGIIFLLKTITIIVILIFCVFLWLPDLFQTNEFYKTSRKITNKFRAPKKNSQFLQSEQELNSTSLTTTTRTTTSTTTTTSTSLSHDSQGTSESSSMKDNGIAPNSDEEIISEPSTGKLDSWLKKMEIQYAETNDRIKIVCQKYNLSDPTKANYRQMMIDTTHHLGFCRNAKVGSTTWMHHFNDLLPVDERPWGDGTGTLKDRIRSAIGHRFKPKELLANEQMNPGKVLPEHFKKLDYTVFTFVRHPFERLVSAYNDKINTEKVSFSAFADKVIDKFAQQKPNIHWRTFVSRCQHCSIPYTVVGRMETFAEDVQYIILKNKLEKLLPLNTVLKFKSLNSSKRDVNDTTQITLERFSQLNKKQIEKLHKIYQLDFELFGYDIDIFLQPFNKKVA